MIVLLDVMLPFFPTPGDVDDGVAVGSDSGSRQ